MPPSSAQARQTRDRGSHPAGPGVRTPRWDARRGAAATVTPVPDTKSLALTCSRAQRAQVTPDIFSLPELLLEPPSPASVAEPPPPPPQLGSSAAPATHPQPPQEQHVALSQMMHQTLAKCDPDIRKDLLQNVLLTGAGSLFSGMPERLHRELTGLLPSALKPRIIAPSVIERRFSTWIGGSVLASLGSFQQLWLSNAEFNEGGWRHDANSW